MPQGNFRYLLFSKAIGKDIAARINAVIPDLEPMNENLDFFLGPPEEYFGALVAASLNIQARRRRIQG